MNFDFLSSAALEEPLKFLTSLGIGLLLGLQRQRTPSARAGLRTFALVALFGTASGLIADAGGGAWAIGSGLLVVGFMIIAAYRREEETVEADSGTTTVIAVLLCYGLGVMTWYGHSQLAAAVGIVATALLHFKSELHGISERLSRDEIASILQLAVLSFIVLPLLPNRGFGPYEALNPYHIWMMVVLVSGVSLTGYMALRMVGVRRSLVPVGIFGGLISSTATALVYARHGKAQPALMPIAAVIILLANLVVLVRLAVISAAVAPSVLPALLPVLGGGLAAGVAALALRFRGASSAPSLQLPDFKNPAQLRVALAFGALYAIVLVGSAWLSERAGSHGLYLLAFVSGFVDVDAITLSGLALANSGKISAETAATAIGAAYFSATVLKLCVLGFMGGRSMLRFCAPSLIAPVLGIAAVLLFVS